MNGSPTTAGSQTLDGGALDRAEEGDPVGAHPRPPATGSLVLELRGRDRRVGDRLTRRRRGVGGERRR
ncbi:MAG: hypothetical protein AVDCRST_MAG05-1904 [uncultured Rubrobacteraceae bacterium]|uniref:Uncharacterized protein n=1 Tax=uncultured Rubrobacteraceae bacterium TaxID=349277 RepID=A0A6J4SI85_9ACTN|nr:MAG: hypothetical protein AVDCRST_MAG05-1904 [uncultured Rubrobacteraceae bacterium]